MFARLRGVNLGDGRGLYGVRDEETPAQLAAGGRNNTSFAFTEKLQCDGNRSGIHLLRLYLTGCMCL